MSENFKYVWLVIRWFCFSRILDRLRTIDRVDVPTLMVQGAADACDPPERTEAHEDHEELF